MNDDNPYAAPQIVNDPEPKPDHIVAVFVIGLLIGVTALFYCIWSHQLQWIIVMIAAMIGTGVICAELDDRFIKRHAKWANEREYGKHNQ